jgi:hypothetical protein
MVGRQLLGGASGDTRLQEHIVPYNVCSVVKVFLFLWLLVAFRFF